jgi:hypothetical protein
MVQMQETRRIKDLFSRNYLAVAALKVAVILEGYKVQLLQGKIVIITGASRARGMGRVAARKFAEHGANVVVTDIIRQGHT